MTERENVLHIIQHDGKAEWIPYGSDCIEMVIPTDVVRERPPFSEGSGYDWFGCYWEFEADIMGASPIPGRQPVKDITKWREQVTFPDLDAVDWSKAKETVSKLDRENKLFNFFWESGPWERLHALVGFEEALVALYTEPEAVLELMEAITDHKLKVIDKIAEYYNPDIVTILDDFGHQRGPFMSNEMFREFIQPFDKRLGDALTAHGILYCHHSCGKIDSLMSDILDMGPKIILGLFAPYNDAKAMAEKYGDKVVFYGPIDSQLISIPDSSNEKIIEEVHRCIDVHAPHRCLIYDAGTFDPIRTELIYREYKNYSKDYYRSPSKSVNGCNIL